jgi:dihydrofolate reductase
VQFDTLIMSRRTYEAAIPRLGEKVFAGVTTFVFSRTMNAQDHPRATILPELKPGWVHSLKNRPGKDIWLMVGSNLFRSSLDAGCIDTVEVNVNPGHASRRHPAPPAAIIDQAEVVRQQDIPRGRISLAYEVRG